MNYLKNVATLKLDVEKCIGCEQCLAVCPHEVFAVENGKASIVDLDACMECGACAKNCPVNALSVKTGVGCASGILNGLLNGNGECCCDKGGCCG
jgi:NAD-dependent dihydropyrimidine dehydrogenase PreA subunit